MTLHPPAKLSSGLSAGRVASPGDYVWLEIVFRPIYSESGSLTELQSSCRDISDRNIVEADNGEKR